MSRIIRMTPEMIEEAKQRFEHRMKTMNCTDGKIQYIDTFQPTGDKATIWYTPDAYVKQIALIQEMDKEVAWHGVATRVEGAEGFNYLISDIMVYPQEVTGATVNTDQAEYEQWMAGLDNDVFNNLRFQGHSHVRMATTPSSVDLEHQYKIVQQLEDDMFYIFMIWNKEFKYTAKIYDMKYNVLFEPADISVGMFGASTSLSKFMESAKTMVKNKPYTYNNGVYRGGNGYNSYSGYQTPASTTKPAASTNTPATTPASTATTQETTVPSRPKTCIGNGWSGAANHKNDYSTYEDDYYKQYGYDLSDGCYGGN